MNLWNTNNLAKEFASDAIGSRRMFQYFVAFIALLGLSEFIRYGSDGGTIVGVVVYLASLLGGAWWCYRTNSSVDNMQYIDRVVAFAVTTFWQVVLFVLILIPVIYGVGKIFGFTEPGQSSMAKTLSMHLWNALVYLFWFWAIQRGIRKISKYR